MVKVHSDLIGALALALLAAACATTGARPKPFPTPDSTGTKDGRPTGSTAASPPDLARTPSWEGRVGVEIDSLVRTALELRGVRYRNGGADPDGFDCSGFTQYVFAQHGLALPRGVRDQFLSGTSVHRSDLRPGDLLFFTTTAPGASHVGIALEDDQFVHAPNSAGVVRVEHLDADHWSRRYIGARRMIQQE